LFAGQAYGNAVGVVSAEELEDEDTRAPEDDMVLEVDEEDVTG
jgi:hypothetical protein